MSMRLWEASHRHQKRHDRQPVADLSDVTDQLQHRCPGDLGPLSVGTRRLLHVHQRRPHLLRDCMQRFVYTVHEDKALRQ